MKKVARAKSKKKPAPYVTSGASIARASVFTPTHRADYLLETYESLRKQTEQRFEWVIVLNGSLSDGSRIVPLTILADPRVKLFNAPANMNGRIGALKRFACSKCTTGALIELDHDDTLTPDAIRKILNAMDDGAGFVYSDFSNFRPNDSCEIYSPDFGWTCDKARRVMHAFDCDARSLYEIFYAPNHVRAWTSRAYDLAGGHDEGLEVCDDHDLLCRTYLSGSEMHRIPECLYRYRLQDGGTNTYLERNALIQQKQHEVGNKYFYRLVDEWASRMNLPKYDLGGRLGCPPGYVSIDLQDAEIICDVTTGLPFNDSTVGVIRAADFLEHIPPQYVVRVMNEIYRVLAPGGWLLSQTPSTDGRGAFQDPTHVSFWNTNSFWYYTRREQAKYVPHIRCRFQATRVWNEYPSDWHRTHEIVYAYADLMALKGQRVPGVQEI